MTKIILIIIILLALSMVFSTTQIEPKQAPQKVYVLNLGAGQVPDQYVKITHTNPDGTKEVTYHWTSRRVN